VHGSEFTTAKDDADIEIKGRMKVNVRVAATK
jgi:hypothetical protein